MTPDYTKVWEALNNLEMVTSKICSAREILDSAIDALENKNQEKTETLMYAIDEFLKYYLAEFDEKFKIAWKETVVKLKEEDPCMPPWGHSDLEYGLANPTLTQDRVSNFPGEQYTEEELNAMCDAAEKQEKDKVIRWQLPVEEVENGDTGEQEYFITLPDDLLEAANLKEGEEVEWVDNGDGSFILRKPQKETFVDPYKDGGVPVKYEMIDGVPTLVKTEKGLTYNEAVAAGYEMTADGFWIKE